MTYNLLDEPWIPVLRTNGTVSRVGIRTALTEAKNIRQIVASSPLDRFAIVRFLLAVKYWCEGSPPPHGTNLSTTSLSSGGLSKLDGKREDFDLFGKGRRFYQFEGGSNSQLSANHLLHEIPTGTNFSHFRHASDREDGLCPACCAMGLVRLPVFTTMGGQGKVRGQGRGPGINMAPPIYAIPLGESLYQTLEFSWVPVSGSDLGIPAWEVPDTPLPGSGVVPLLTGLTWLPRRVWLEEPGNLEKCCIACGQKERLVVRTVFEGRGKTRPGTWQDPHSLPNVKKGTPGLRALDTVKKSDATAGQWMSIVEALLSKAQEAPRSWYVVALATYQNKYSEAVEWYVPSNPSPSMKDTMLRAFKKWERGWDVNSLLKELLPGVKGSRHDGEAMRLHSMLDSVRPQAEQEMFAQVMEWLKSGQENWGPSTENYQRMLALISGTLFPGPTVSAVENRRQVTQGSSSRAVGVKMKSPRDPMRRSGI